jgi:hypothetical protein
MRIRHDGEAAIHRARRRRCKLHAKALALIRRQAQRCGQARHREAGTRHHRLGHAQRGSPSVRDTNDLRTGVANFRTDRKDVWRHRKRR